MSITAMRQALAAIEYALDRIQPESDVDCQCPLCEADEALRLAIEQAEKQEPVAWMQNESFVDTENLWDVRVTFNKNGNGIPLYTTPPAAQRQPEIRTAGCTLCGHCAATGERISEQRQPLTRNELHLALTKAGIKSNGVAFEHEVSVARAIEAAHGIGEKK